MCKILMGESLHENAQKFNTSKEVSLARVGSSAARPLATETSSLLHAGYCGRIGEGRSIEAADLQEINRRIR